MITRSPRTRFALAALLVLAAGCASRQKDLSKFVAAEPRSILVVPAVNNTVDVNATDYFLSTVPIPLAERGYYIFPVHLVKRLLEDDGLADASLVHHADPARLGALFGADAILYLTILRWDAKWMLIQTSVTVEFEYVLKDAKTGAVIWQERQTMNYTSGNGGGGLLSAVVNAAVTKAAPNYMPLARRANAVALTYPGPGFPAGPYRDDHDEQYQAVRAAPPEPPPAAQAR